MDALLIPAFVAAVLITIGFAWPRILEPMMIGVGVVAISVAVMIATAPRTMHGCSDCTVEWGRYV